MSEEKKVSRRKYVAYAGAGVVVVAAAAAGGYYATRKPATPTPTPTPTPSPTPTPTAPATPTPKITPTPTKQPFKGKKITIGVYGGGTRGPISGPVYYWRDKWEEETGATLEIAEIPFGELHEKIFTDLVTGKGFYDGFIGPAWFYGDYIAGNFIVPIDDYMRDPRFPKWDPESVAPPMRQIHRWGETWYGTPYDFDSHILYYRKDVLTNTEYQTKFREKYGYDLPVPPRTVDQLYDVAKFFNGWDWNGDGEDDYGWALNLKRGFFKFSLLDIPAPYAVMPGPKVDRYHNIYYFDPETMEPYINKPGTVRAIDMLRKLYEDTGPKAMAMWDLTEVWDLFLRGKLVFTWTFGDLGSLAQTDPRSVVKGKIGCSAFPGSYEVWDLEKGEWKKFDEPNKVANLQGPSWHGVISRFSHNPDVTYHLYAWLNQPERIFWTSCQGWSGVDPGRDFQFLRPDVDPRQKMGKGSPEDAIKAGWNLDDRKEYTFGFYDNYYNSVTRQEYLRIPGTEEYWDTLELYVQEAVVLGKDTKTQLDKVYEEWERITDTLGRDKQRLYYQQDIGYGRPVG